MNQNDTLLATEICDLLRIDLRAVRRLIDTGALTPVYIDRGFNLPRVARFSRQQVEGLNK